MVYGFGRVLSLWVPGCVTNHDVSREDVAMASALSDWNRGPIASIRRGSRGLPSQRTQTPSPWKAVEDLPKFASD